MIRQKAWLVPLALLAACTAGPVREVTELPPPGQVAPGQIPPSVAELPQVPSKLPATTPAQRPRSAEVTPRRSDRPAIDELFLGGGKPVDAKAPQPARGPRSLGDITLDFKDTDVQEVVRVILGDLLRANFVLDPDVTGPVTLQTGRPITKAALLPMLEVVLQGRGIRIVPYGNVYRVTRAAGIAAVSLGGVQVGTDRIPDGAGIRVYPLEFINAAEMAAILKPMLADNAVFYVDDARNMVIVAGTGPELALASGTVGIFDVDQMAGQSVLLTSLEHVDADVMAAELEGIFSATGKSGPRGPVRFIPVDRLNAVMVISRQTRYIEEARHWIHRLDRTRNAHEKRLYVYYVQNGRAADLARTLRGVFTEQAAAEAPPAGDTRSPPPRRPQVYRAPTAAELQRGGPVTLPPGTALQAEATPPGQPPRPPAAPGTPPTLAGGEAAQPRLASAVRITADEKNNALLISAVQRDFELIQDVLEKLDLLPLQVVIEATIFEVTLRDQLRYGLQYLISNGGLGVGKDGTTVLTRGTSLTDLAPIAQSSLPGFAFTIAGTDRVRFVLDALSSITEVNVISSPHILVLDNQSARLQVGDEVPIVTQQATSTVTDNPLIVNTVQYRNTGVTLEVTPRVNASGLVTLDIAQEVSDVTQTTTSTINSPTINQRLINSTVAVQDSETIMLGGLIREQANATKSGIPVLHRIPVIGPLFGSTDNSTVRTELIVLLTPRVISNAQDARDMTVEMRRKFLGLLALQREGVRQPRRIIKDDSF